MARLNLYEDKESGSEYVVIINSKEYEEELNSDTSLILRDSINLLGDLTSWPADRFLVQE